MLRRLRVVPLKYEGSDRRNCTGSLKIFVQINIFTTVSHDVYAYCTVATADPRLIRLLGWPVPLGWHTLVPPTRLLLQETVVRYCGNDAILLLRRHAKFTVITAPKKVVRKTLRLLKLLDQDTESKVSPRALWVQHLASFCRKVGYGTTCKYSPIEDRGCANNRDIPAPKCIQRLLARLHSRQLQPPAFKTSTSQFTLERASICIIICTCTVCKLIENVGYGVAGLRPHFPRS